MFSWSPFPCMLAKNPLTNLQHVYAYGGTPENRSIHLSLVDLPCLSPFRSTQQPEGVVLGKARHGAQYTTTTAQPLLLRMWHAGISIVSNCFPALQGTKREN